MANDDFSSELILRSGDDEAKIPDIARPILQALQNTLIGVEETHKARFRRPIICGVDDLQQLVHLLSQWIDTHGPISSSAQVSCLVVPADRIRGDKRLSYKSMESFILRYCGITDTTKSVTVTFSAILKLPKSNKLDRIVMAIEVLGSSPFVIDYQDEDSIEPLGRDYSYHPEYCNLTIDMRYTNYLVAKGLAEVAEDWVRNLPLALESRKMSKL